VENLNDVDGPVTDDIDPPVAIGTLPVASVTEEDIVRIERDIEALKAETVKLAMAFASLAQEIDQIKHPRPALDSNTHPDG
jgi:hypothetical protein